MNKTNGQKPGLTTFIARLPIFDRKKQVYAYELLYRSDLVNRAHVINDEYATLKVIANGLLIGLQRLTTGKRAFIHFNHLLLVGQIPLLFPTDLLGVEIFEQVEPDERLIQVLERIKKAGYLMVMDDFVFDEPFRQLLQFADMIKVDFLVNSPEQIRLIAREAASQKLTLLAEKIETREKYNEALELGFHYFQGFFFQKPDLVSRQEMPGYKLNYLHILKKIHDPVLELEEVEEIIKRDVSLTYKLLRFINSASFGFRVTVRSVRHALNLLGKREIKKWLTIIVMSGIGQQKPPELVHTAVIRGRLCELIAARFKLRQKPAEAFLTGIFSLMDAFMDRPLEDILEELPLEDHVKAALLGKEDSFGNPLEVVKAFEKAQWEDVGRYSTQLKLEEDKLACLYLEAVEWTKFLSEEPKQES
ncbi:MAG: HDOD domain-containing protein [Candidatus Aminicenantes bacterium]|jgi:EAL and modified HD-GYP domain-containing signal transduction protein